MLLCIEAYTFENLRLIALNSPIANIFSVHRSSKIPLENLYFMTLVTLTWFRHLMMSKMLFFAYVLKNTHFDNLHLMTFTHLLRDFKLHWNWKYFGVAQLFCSKNFWNFWVLHYSSLPTGSPFSMYLYLHPAILKLKVAPPGAQNLVRLSPPRGAPMC